MTLEPRRPAEYDVIATTLAGDELRQCRHVNTTDVVSSGELVARLCLDCDEQLQVES
jgi:hypothetical protein